MDLTSCQINEKLYAQRESLNMVGDQLRWILKETYENDREIPGSPYANEMGQRFISLYRDFKRIQKEIIDFSEKLNSANYENEFIRKVYYTCSLLLIENSKSGIFEQFTTVMEEGRLPD